MNSRLLPVTILAIALTSPLRAEDAIELKPHWPIGKKISQRMQMDQSSKISLGADPIDQKIAMTMDGTMSIRRHENAKDKRIDMKYDRVTMSMDMAGQSMNYDSEKPGDDALGMGKAFGAIIGKEVRVIVDASDEVIAVENLDAILKEMSAGSPMAAMISQMFNKEAVKNMMRQGSLYATPGKPVKSGDSWKFDHKMPLPQLGKVEMTGAYTLKGMAERAGAKCAEIALDGKLAMDLSGGDSTDPASPLKALGMTMDSGKMTGTLWFDPAIGICRDAQFTQEMTLKMKNPGNPDASIEIPMKQIVKQTVTKIENL
jgi:hypothetical protein